MKKLAVLILLRLKALFHKPQRVLPFFILPLLMSALMGIAVKNNDSERILPGIVDLAQSEDSERFLYYLKEGDEKWQVFPNETLARIYLERDDIQVLLKIPEDFELPKKPELIFASGSRKEALNMIAENATYSLINVLFQSELTDTLLASAKDRVPEEVEREFEAKLREKIHEQGFIELEMEAGGDVRSLAQNLLYLPEYSVEMIFLSFFALAAMLSEDSTAYHQRLKRSFREYFQTSLAELIAILFLGFTQIIIFHFGLRLFFQEMDLDPRALLILFTFFCTQAVIANFFKLLSPDHRLTTALIYSIISASVGGCFFAVPTPILLKAIIISPHAYATALLDGVQLPSPFALLLLCLMLFLISVRLNRKAHLT